MAADDYMRSRFTAPAWCCPAHRGIIRSECPECRIAHLERRLAAADRLRNEVRGILGAFGDDIAEAGAAIPRPTLLRGSRRAEHMKTNDEIRNAYAHHAPQTPDVAESPAPRTGYKFLKGNKTMIKAALSMAILASVLPAQWNGFLQSPTRVPVAMVAKDPRWFGAKVSEESVARETAFADQIIAEMLKLQDSLSLKRSAQARAMVAAGTVKPTIGMKSARRSVVVGRGTQKWVIPFSALDSFVEANELDFLNAQLVGHVAQWIVTETAYPAPERIWRDVRDSLLPVAEEPLTTNCEAYGCGYDWYVTAAPCPTSEAIWDITENSGSKGNCTCEGDQVCHVVSDAERCYVSLKFQFWTAPGVWICETPGGTPLVNENSFATWNKGWTLTCGSNESIRYSDSQSSNCTGLGLFCFVETEIWCYSCAGQSCSPWGN